MTKLRYVLLASTLTTQMVFAEPDAATLKKQWGELLDNADITTIEASGIDGLWEVDAGSHIFYSNDKGDKLIFGDMLSLDPKEGYTNLTEERRKQGRMQLLKSLNKEDMITFAAKDTKHNIYVFTDSDCGYCRKFHEERDDLMKAGISINYLAMPRTPEGTPSYDKSIAIWCAKDRNQALTDAKNEKFKETDKTCAEGEKIVAADVELARQFGAQGTPTIVLENGEVIPGYVPAQRIIDYYAQEKEPTAAAK